MRRTDKVRLAAMGDHRLMAEINRRHKAAQRDVDALALSLAVLDARRDNAAGVGDEWGPAMLRGVTVLGRLAAALSAVGWHCTTPIGAPYPEDLP